MVVVVLTTQTMRCFFCVATNPSSFVLPRSVAISPAAIQMRIELMMR